MTLNCPYCKKSIELSVTNVLRQRIENKINELEIRLVEIEKNTRNLILTDYYDIEKQIELLKDLLK